MTDETWTFPQSCPRHQRLRYAADIAREAGAPNVGAYLDGLAEKDRMARKLPPQHLGKTIHLVAP
jgi:hypothetical protein